jgi:hypothetical protein
MKFALVILHEISRRLVQAVARGFSPRVTFNRMSLAAWQGATKHDLHSAGGAVPGISLPSAAPANANPKAWYEAAFLAHFQPAASWAGDDMGDGAPAGALKSDGSSHGGGPAGVRAWRPEAMGAFPSLALNGGYGWEGPRIVQRRYPLPRGKPLSR